MNLHPTTISSSRCSNNTRYLRYHDGIHGARSSHRARRLEISSGGYDMMGGDVDELPENVRCRRMNWGKGASWHVLGSREGKGLSGVVGCWSLSGRGFIESGFGFPRRCGGSSRAVPDARVLVYMSPFLQRWVEFGRNVAVLAYFFSRSKSRHRVLDQFQRSDFFPIYNC